MDAAAEDGELHLSDASRIACETVDDDAGATSNAATVSINVLADECTAPCNLGQVITAPVHGAAMTLEKAGTNVLLAGTLTSLGPTGCVPPDPIGPDEAEEAPASA